MVSQYPLKERIRTINPTRMTCPVNGDSQITEICLYRMYYSPSAQILTAETENEERIPQQFTLTEEARKELLWLLEAKLLPNESACAYFKSNNPDLREGQIFVERTENYYIFSFYERNVSGTLELVLQFKVIFGYMDTLSKFFGE